LGDYDVNVIGRILETKELEIHWQDRRVTVQLDGLLDPKTVGLLINGNESQVDVFFFITNGLNYG